MKGPAPNPVVPGQVPTKPTYKRRRPGRPTLLTPDVMSRYLTVIRSANYRTVAAALVGLNPNTVEGWIKRGRGQMHDREATPEYVEFARAVEEAEAAAEALIIGNLANRSRVNTEAGKFIASRRWPKRWPADVPDEPPPPPPTVVVDQRQQTQNVIVLTEGQFGDLVRDLLAAQRAERAAAEPTLLIEERQDDKVRRHEHLDPLRAESD